ncbi:MAG TPA: polysaccharide biosynthesis/export family protein [Bryobacteraceae bacterium]|nr:polysaccharide biosynthesis/export family protein [Bryobacteraceae bacterium]
MIRFFTAVFLGATLTAAGASGELTTAAADSSHREAAASDQQFADRNARYRLQPQDSIEVQYRYTPEYNATVAVQPDGYVSLPFVGDVKVGDLSVDRAAAAIAKKAGERLRDPEVNVLLRDYQKPYFTVAGEVEHPGRFDMRGHMTVVEAIAISGGLKESAKHNQIILLRKVDPERAQVRVLDLKKMMSQKGIAEDVAIQPGDMLVVPKNALSKLDPYIRLASTGLFGASTAIMLH